MFKTVFILTLSFVIPVTIQAYEMLVLKRESIFRLTFGFCVAVLLQHKKKRSLNASYYCLV